MKLPRIEQRYLKSNINEMLEIIKPIFTEKRIEELWKGAKVLFWGGLGIAFILILRALGVDLDPIVTSLVALGVNAVTFVSYRFVKPKSS